MGILIGVFGVGGQSGVPSKPDRFSSIPLTLVGLGLVSQSSLANLSLYVCKFNQIKDKRADLPTLLASTIKNRRLKRFPGFKIGSLSIRR